MTEIFVFEQLHWCHIMNKRMNRSIVTCSAQMLEIDCSYTMECFS